MNKHFVQVLLFIIFSMICPTTALAGQSLANGCLNAGGIYFTDQYVINYGTYIKSSDVMGNTPAIVLEYHDHWYRATDSVVPTFIAYLQAAVLMDLKINICVTSTTMQADANEPMRLIGMELTENL